MTVFAPNAIIENLLQRKKAQAAMVLDALFATDAIQLESIEISSILHYFKLSGIFMGESILRRGLFDLARLGVFDTFKILSRTKGRPFWNYRPKTVFKIAQILGVKLHRDENRDPVPFSSFKSVRAYRSDKHYSFLKRLGTSYLSRKKLGKRLGVGARSTFNYELGKDLEVIQRVDRVELSMRDVPFAPSKRISGNTFLEVEITNELGQKETKNMPYTAYILARELRLGRRVFRLKQITNEYIA